MGEGQKQGENIFGSNAIIFTVTVIKIKTLQCLLVGFSFAFCSGKVTLVKIIFFYDLFTILFNVDKISRSNQNDSVQ